MRRYSHVGVPHVTYGRPPTFDGDAQQEGDDQGSSASSSVVLAYISHPTVRYICYLIITYHTPITPRGGPRASQLHQPRRRLTHARRRMVHGVDSLTRRLRPLGGFMASGAKNQLRLVNVLGAPT